MSSRRCENLPEGEERTKLREKFAKAREERQGVIEAIEQNTTKLRGGRPRIEEQQQLIDELQAIQDLAKQEKAEETTKRLGQLIDRQQKGPEGRLPGPPRKDQGNSQRGATSSATHPSTTAGTRQETTVVLRWAARAKWFDRLTILSEVEGL